MNEKRAAAYRSSITVGIVLAILTIVEYFAAVYMAELGMDSTVVLFLLALFKAVAVVNYFMHVSRLWRQEEGH
jgi:caa(3)-type oxidase subunit IV